MNQPNVVLISYTHEVLKKKFMSKLKSFEHFKTNFMFKDQCLSYLPINIQKNYLKYQMMSFWYKFQIQSTYVLLELITLRSKIYLYIILQCLQMLILGNIFQQA